AWVEGWARAPQNVGGGAALTIEGENAAGSGEGIFGQLISRSTSPNESWVVTVAARFADGSETARDFVLDGAAVALPGTAGFEELFDDGLTDLEREARFGAEGETAAETVRPGEAKRVALGTHASIDIPAGALNGQSTITMKQLSRESLPPLDPGMINVTAPFARGYEMLPHGQRFQEAVTITLPYQENLLPQGYTGHDVETYFYDEELRRWRKLAREGVDPRTGTVRSLTDHFTVMIDAIVVTPEHPQVASFDGNRISGLEAANPAAGIAMIAPPEANNRGDAVLSYPLAVPPGRLGMQPELAITYNSSAGNGWLGMGWDLGVSTISVDTRFGVPRYRPTEESESYLLDGQQLTPDAISRTGFAERDMSATEKEFQPRVEGAFQRIVRKGKTPSTFTWEVTSRAGVKYRYGGTGAKLGDDDGNVYRWALREIEDLHGNRVRFAYDVVRASEDDGDGLEGRELYLRAIHYTLRTESNGVYQVHFCGEPRDDVILSGRGGFKEEMRERLRRVEVHYVPQGAGGTSAGACGSSAASTQVRAWNLAYGADPFGKSQLLAISPEGARGGEQRWGDHAFEYFDDLTEGGSLRGFQHHDVQEFNVASP
ncbi:MAG: hypothetical protein H5U40_12305, partial [Polyangiaceae bacterium]|nr:hypothetical protein [Polyangiaceae bacterium]